MNVNYQQNILVKQVKPLKIKVFGLFPTLYTICSPCLSNDYINEKTKDFKLKQYLEYPKWVQKNNEKMIELVNDLINYFGNRIRIEIVNADSLRGILLAIRHRLKVEMAVIIEGKVFKGESLKPRTIREHVKKLLRERYLTV